jgi:hypothetical protein
MLSGRIKSMTASQRRSAQDATIAKMIDALSLPRLDAHLRRIAELRSLAAIAFVVAVLLLAMIPPNGVLNDNEEHYFAAARQYFDPAAVPEHSALLGGMPHAFAFYAVAGALLKVASFETTQMLGRLLAIVLYTIALTRFFRALSFSALDAALVLVVFYLTGQYLVGEEWLFRGLEPKVLAYPAVFWGLTDIIQGRSLRGYLWLALATWFHFLVGALWAGLLTLALWIDGRSIRELSKCLIAFAAAVAPLLGYLLLRDYGAAPVRDQAGMPTVGWIITYYRSTHHSAPFLSLWSFMAWLPGLLATAVILIWSAFYARTSTGDARVLALTVSTTCMYLLLATVAAGVDRGGFLGPFTIFRPSSVALFLALVLATRWLSSTGASGVSAKLVATGISLALAVPALALNGVEPVREQAQAHARLDALYKYVAASSGENDRFLIEPKLERSFLSFERRADRALLVMNKFIPAEPHDVFEWYRRRQFQEQLFAKGCTGESAYHVDYLIAAKATAHELAPTCGQIVFEHADVAIIRHDAASKSK